jgi:magnesium-transporting ATPase (P-type)
MARVVIACRVRPAQKAEIVKMVREGVKPEPVTLAIGDGANDVAMIQEAHVGVGVIGNEGMQAVRASDYSIAQFRFLERLLLVHGRWNYSRICFLILYSFYKNITFVFTLFYYGFYTGFSGTTLYESFLGAGWNIAFTLLPVLFYGMCEKDIHEDTATSNPISYIIGQKNEDFSISRMGTWILTALLHSIIIFVFCSQTVASSFGLDHTGQPASLFTLGTIVNFCTMLTVTVKVCFLLRCLSSLFFILPFLLLSHRSPSTPSTGPS